MTSRSDAIAAFAPAKINLFLHVGEKRSDGFHELESLVVFVAAGDTLSFAPSRELTLTVEGRFAEGLKTEGDNLVLHAARALAARAGREAGAAIALTKNLPIASGIGGGSADAAATLRGLMRLWALDLSWQELRAVAETLGSDVPVCVDCHKAHDIGDPRTTSWKLKLVDACAKCHTNKAVMAKYNLSTDVVKTYLNDFHGMSASLSSSGRTPRVIAALCVDCHGTHDITKAKDGSSQVLQANLQKTCAKCHPGAPKNFTAAWLSHYEPSPKRAPLVWAVGVFYKIFIPFLIGGLVLQILLSLWRVMVNR